MYCSRNVVVCSPHRQDSALYNFCSICYNSDKERKREREKLNKTTQQLSVFIWHEFLSLYCSRNVVVCSPHRQAGALYNFCSICYNSDKERKSEREKERKSERAKERNLASHRDRLQGQAPRTPVAGGNPHAHLNGTVEHPGLPAPSQEASPPHPPSNRRRQAPRTPRPTAGASPCRTPLHPATELSHASTELCDTLACRHLRSIDTVYVHI